MSKRDRILAALKRERGILEMNEEAVANQRATVEALEAALKAEEEAIQYDAYVAEQEAKAESEVF